MKKIAFIAQVVTLIAALPVLVVIEMNHPKAAPTDQYMLNAITQTVKIMPADYPSTQVNVMNN